MKLRIPFLRYYSGLKLFALIFCLLPGYLSLAQNIIPNSNFEKHIGPKVLYWDQPSPGGNFYHYDSMQVENGYNHVNGICFLNSDNTEYLQVILKHPLEKGMKYTARMAFKIAYMYESIGRINKIGWFFSDSALDVHTRTQINANPQVVFQLSQYRLADTSNWKYSNTLNGLSDKYDHIRDTSKWKDADTTFIADGNEKYLIIGHFFNDNSIRAKDSASKWIKNIRYLENKQLVSLDSECFSQISMAPNPSGNDKQRITEAITYCREKNEELVRKLYKPKFDSIHQKFTIEPEYDLRLYFDNLCLSPYLAGEPGSCSQEDCFDSLRPGKIYSLQNITFDIDKYEILPPSFDELDELVLYLFAHPEYQLKIGGHTDNSGTETHNLELSQNRAKAVMDYLANKGIDAKRLTYEGFGSSKPVADNNTEEGKHKNRRVEFMLTN